MKSFRTTFEITPSKLKIRYGDSLLLMGSCFTENIGIYLIDRKFNVCLNPHGIIYNPYSIETSIREIAEEKEYTEDDIEFFNGKWISMNHHGSFSDVDKYNCLDKINDSIHQGHRCLQTAKFVFITLGTSFVYFDNSTKCPVGNCHKMPASEFNVRMLSFEDVVSSLSRIVDSINRINNNVEIVFTVSPIRHWKDGTVENQRSKATLLLGVGEICKTCHNVSYFPAYELIMDDLRDYRFYKEDMLHPNETAIEYTWEKFKTTYIDADCYSIMAEVEKLHKALSHKVEDTVSEEYIKYCEYVNKQRKIVEDLLSPFNI